MFVHMIYRFQNLSPQIPLLSTIFFLLRPLSSLKYLKHCNFSLDLTKKATHTCQTGGRCTWWSPWRSRWCRWHLQSRECPPPSASASPPSPQSLRYSSRSGPFFSPWQGLKTTIKSMKQIITLPLSSWRNNSICIEVGQEKAMDWKKNSQPKNLNENEKAQLRTGPSVLKHENWQLTIHDMCVTVTCVTECYNIFLNIFVFVFVLIMICHICYLSIKVDFPNPLSPATISVNSNPGRRRLSNKITKCSYFGNQLFLKPKHKNIPNLMPPQPNV